MRNVYISTLSFYTIAIIPTHIMIICIIISDVQYNTLLLHRLLLYIGF